MICDITTLTVGVLASDAGSVTRQTQNFSFASLNREVTSTLNHLKVKKFHLFSFFCVALICICDICSEPVCMDVQQTENYILSSPGFPSVAIGSTQTIIIHTTARVSGSSRIPNLGQLLFTHFLNQRFPKERKFQFVNDFFLRQYAMVLF